MASDQVDRTNFSPWRLMVRRTPPLCDTPSTRYDVQVKLLATDQSMPVGTRWADDGRRNGACSRSLLSLIHLLTLVESECELLNFLALAFAHLLVLAPCLLHALRGLQLHRLQHC